MKEKIVNLIANHVEGMTAEEIATMHFLASDWQRLCTKHQT